MPPFTWLKPDVYPLLVAIGTGVALSAYTGVRCLYTNPEVFINKEVRNDQMAESDWFVKKSDQYSRSMFRTLAEIRGKPHIFPNDTFGSASNA